MLELIIAAMIAMACPGHPTPAPTTQTTQSTADTGGDSGHIPPGGPKVPTGN